MTGLVIYSLGGQIALLQAHHRRPSTREMWERSRFKKLVCCDILLRSFRRCSTIAMTKDISNWSFHVGRQTVRLSDTPFLLYLHDICVVFLNTRHTMEFAMVDSYLLI